MVRPPLTNRTLAQLHLEDLEPHRFEDLVRQLLYDFRSWRQLEATGRSGGDGGFDARGFEIVAVARSEAPIVEVEADDSEEATGEADEVDRLWLIQCKREKSIGPAKARQYLADLNAAAAASAPYGLVIAAACDLSKRTRDVIRDEARTLGFAEVHIWAKGEIEDQLFQPKNDHLLFAYTGISLQIRKRSLRTEIRARLATKRKVKRAIVDQPFVLVREASDDRYPYQGAVTGHWSGRRHWNVYTAGKCKHDGLHIELVRCFAYVDHDGEHWDAALAVNLAANPGGSQDPWTTNPGMDPLHAEAIHAWNALLASQRAFYKERVVIPYDQILDVDSEGDDWFAAPHIYVADFDPRFGPFAPGEYVYVAAADTWSGLSCSADPAMRVAQFPEHLRVRHPTDSRESPGDT